jgi:hypothetical protein
VGTTIKLARALWIVPLSLVTAVALKSKARVQWPFHENAGGRQVNSDFDFDFVFAILRFTFLP